MLHELLSDALRNSWLVMWVAITAICVVPVAGHYWAKVTKAGWEAGLKQSMIDRGMSAAEIERVLRAGRRRSRSADAERQEGAT